MSKKRSYKLLLVADGTSKIRGLQLSRLKLTFIATFFLLLIGSSVYVASNMFARSITQHATAELLNENHELNIHLVRLTERLSDVDTQLDQLANSDDQLRLLVDMPKIDQDVREVGIGGVIQPDVINDDQNVRKLIFDIDKIEREIRLQRSSFIDISRQMNEQQDLIAHTPSIRPIEGGFCSSTFGYRNDPFNNRRKHHNGVDFSVERGTPVLASADGKVVFSKRTPGLGNLIVVDHDYDVNTAYGHLSKINVSKGQLVKRGQKIGEVGNTGRSTAPHLHYEVRKERKPVDPMDYIFQNYASLPDK